MYYFAPAFVWTDGEFLEDGHWSLVLVRQKSNLTQLAPSSYFSGWDLEAQLLLCLSHLRAISLNRHDVLKLYGYLWLDSGYLILISDMKNLQVTDLENGQKGLPCSHTPFKVVVQCQHKVLCRRLSSACSSLRAICYYMWWANRLRRYPWWPRL